jgi:xanthine dehydrogenase small subunit
MNQSTTTGHAATIQTGQTATASESGAAITVNGQHRSLDGVGSHTTALDWLRGNGLTGSKEGCAEGECGACAIMVAQPDGAGGTAWTAVNSCLVPVAALDGGEVVTSEGLGTPDCMHPVQAELAAGGSSQCGYCTPGFACSMAAEFYRPGRIERARAAAGSGKEGAQHDTAQHDTAQHDPNQPPHEIPDSEHGPNGFDLHALSGNLCRCTGYRPIRDAAYALGEPAEDDVLARRRSQPAPEPLPTDIVGADGRFVRPPTLADALELLAANPTAVLVAGSTDWGVEVNLRGRRVPLVIAIDRIQELRVLETTPDHVEIGAGLSLSETERMLDGRIPLLAELFPQFASRLIRNRATIGGNLGTGSPIGDTPPALLALGARLVLASTRGEREIELAEYFTGYRQTVRRPDELIRAIRVPLPLAGITAFHKIAKRRFDDISSVAVGFAIDVEDGIVTSARIGLGGVAATPLRATATEGALIGQPWNANTIGQASAVLGGEGTPMDDHRASASYRRIMLSRALSKLFATRQEAATDASEGQADDGQAIDDKEARHEFTI